MAHREVTVDASTLQRLLEERLPDCRARVIDDAGDGEHFQAIVASSAFAGRSLVEQHRMVYEALGDLLRGPVHALALKTCTPDRWPETA